MSPGGEREAMSDHEEKNKPTCTKCHGAQMLPAGGGMGIELERACPSCVDPAVEEHDPATCPVKDCAECAVCTACGGSGINPLGSTCLFCGGVNRARTRIAERLVKLADEMDLLAVAMAHFGGDVEAMEHRIEIARAGKIARQWAETWG